MALYRRNTTGEGDFVDVSMFESVLAASPNIMGPVFGGNQAPERLRERTHGGNAMLNIYETADRQFIALGGGEHKFVEALFDGLDRPDFVLSSDLDPAGEGHWPANRVFAAPPSTANPCRMGDVVRGTRYMLEPCELP
jgi:crotonobetainyl-CoA:carnitine CoA-transferase CaiB-like acyl-CoA transferase